MMEGPYFLISEPEMNFQEVNISTPCPLPATCNFLRTKWLAKIATNRQHISQLMHNIWEHESFQQNSEGKTVHDATSFFISNPQTQQKNLIHSISNLLLSSPGEDPEKTTAPYSKCLELMREKGYQTLIEKLDHQAIFVLEEIEKISSPILIEQLLDIFLICHIKYPTNNAMSQAAMEFALNIAHMASSDNLNLPELINDAKHILGQFIYLINRDPFKTIKAIDTPQYNTAIENLRNEFSHSIQEICQRLQEHYLAHYKTQLQDPDMALHTLLPFEIAKALLTDIGTINVGIIDILADIFLSNEKPPLNHEVNLAYALNLFQNSPRFRSEFEKIRRPISLKSPSNDVIRSSLRLDSSVHVTDLHARLSALTALLSHPRQGDESSCFAVSLVIEILSSHLGLCLKDLQQILKEGKLKRTVKGVQKDIPFLKRILDENLHKKIVIDRSGSLIFDDQKQAKLWEAPGLQAVCQAIGITNHKEALSLIGQSLFMHEQQKTSEIEIKIIIQKLCEYALKHNEFSKPPLIGDLYSQACFTFSSQVSQPLLKIWENAIASMAEAEEGSMIKTSILDSTLTAFQRQLSQLKIPPTLFLQHFFHSVQKSLSENVRLQYDPAINRSSPYLPSFKEGGFVLYDQKKRIDSEKAFRLFLLDILFEVNEKLHKSKLSDSDKLELNQTLEILTPSVDTSNLMGCILAQYHPSNKNFAHHLIQGQTISSDTLPFTPWVTHAGNNSKAVLKVYFEANDPIESEKIISNNAQEALSNIIELCKRMSQQEKQLYLNNPHKLKPLCILGKHRFPFMVGHPSFSNAWQADCSTQEWINRFVLTPGREVANTLLDSQTRDQVLENLQKNTVLHSFAKPREVFNLYLEQMKQISVSLTIQQFRQALFNIWKDPGQMTSLQLEEIARQIDTSLSQSLAPTLKKKLGDSAVHVADTNWCNGIQDIHFCFVVNPGTGELELWKAYANGSHLVALDQNEWIHNQKWEFLTIPAELAPDDNSSTS